MPADDAFRNDLPAGFAAVVVGIEAVLAEAVVAGDAVFLDTIVAEQLIVYRCAFSLRKHSSAVVANSYFFFHFKFLQKQKFR